MSDELEKEAHAYGRKIAAKFIGALIILPLVYLLWPWAIPFGFWELWESRGTVTDWFTTAWPLLAWGSGVTALASFLTHNDRRLNLFAEDILAGGFIVSLIAGVSEEILYRWLFFLHSIVAVQVFNWLFFGWAGFGIIEFLYAWVLGPLANGTTLGYLEPYLYHPAGWYVGAAMVSANGFFRDGHKYLGMFGFVNSWFCGMFLFWFMFRYGIGAAILIHFTYDFLIYAIRYADAVIERAQGRV